MNKTELIDFAAEEANVSKAEAGRVLESMLKAITKELCNNRQVSLPGFGSFSASHRAARQGRNPQTGETIQIGASWNAKFKAGKALKDAIQDKLSD